MSAIHSTACVCKVNWARGQHFQRAALALVSQPECRVQEEVKVPPRQKAVASASTAALHRLGPRPLPAALANQHCVKYSKAATAPQSPARQQQIYKSILRESIFCFVRLHEQCATHWKAAFPLPTGKGVEAPKSRFWWQRMVRESAHLIFGEHAVRQSTRNGLRDGAAAGRHMQQLQAHVGLPHSVPSHRRLRLP